MEMEGKEIPVLYADKKDCCGCTACYAICPKSAISMQPDDEGFDYPVIDESMCIRCNQCIKVCPIKKTDDVNFLKKVTFNRTVIR